MYTVRSLRRLMVRPLLLCGLWAALSSSLQAASYWQLTFVYNENGLFLLRAAPMPPLAKAVRTPGLEGAVLKLDYDLEWRSAQGQVVQTAPVTIPLGGRVVMSAGPVPGPHDQRVSPEGAFVVRVEGPADAA